MDGSAIAGAEIRKPAKRGAKLKRQDAGEVVTYGVDARYVAVANPSQIIGRYVCTPAWSPRQYPPIPDDAACAMLACEGKSCGALWDQRRRDYAGGRLYPFYYRTSLVSDCQMVRGREEIRWRWLCYDCWQGVLLERRNALDDWYQADSFDADSSPAGPAMDAMEEAGAGGISEMEIGDGTAELMEMELGDDFARLRDESPARAMKWVYIFTKCAVESQ